MMKTLGVRVPTMGTFCSLIRGTSMLNNAVELAAVDAAAAILVATGAVDMAVLGIVPTL